MLHWHYVAVRSNINIDSIRRTRYTTVLRRHGRRNLVAPPTTPEPLWVIAASHRPINHYQALVAHSSWPGNNLSSGGISSAPVCKHTWCYSYTTNCSISIIYSWDLTRINHTYEYVYLSCPMTHIAKYITICRYGPMSALQQYCSAVDNYYCRQSVTCR